MNVNFVFECMENNFKHIKFSNDVNGVVLHSTFYYFKKQWT